MTRLPPLGAFLMVGLLVACERSGRVPSDIVTRDSSGVLIVEIPGTAVASAPEWTTDARPLLAIGEPTEGEPSQFSRLTGVRLLREGRLMFATDASKQLFTVDSTGVTLTSRGRMGNGPFEFQHLQMIPSPDASVLALFDALRQQVTELPLNGAEHRTVSLAALGIGSSIPLARFSDGHLLVQRQGPLPEPSAEGVVAGLDSIVRVNDRGEVIAPFGRHPSDDRVLRRTPGGGLTGGRPPFGRKLLATADDSVVVVAASADRQFILYPSRGGPPRLIRVSQPRRAVDDATRRAYRERVLRDVRDEYGRREWTMLSSDDVFPGAYPAFDALLLDREGSIWLRESVAPSDAVARWAVFGREGLPLARVQLPARFTPSDISRDRIAGVWIDDLGGEQVQVWSLTRH